MLCSLFIACPLFGMTATGRFYCTIKMSMYKNQCMINSMMWNSFEVNAGICQLTDVLKYINTCTSVVPVFSAAMVSFRCILVF